MAETRYSRGTCLTLHTQPTLQARPVAGIPCHSATHASVTSSSQQLYQRLVQHSTRALTALVQRCMPSTQVACGAAAPAEDLPDIGRDRGPLGGLGGVGWLRTYGDIERGLGAPDSGPRAAADRVLPGPLYSGAARALPRFPVALLNTSISCMFSNRALTLPPYIR